jgi:hypothetical protein
VGIEGTSMTARTHCNSVEEVREKLRAFASFRKLLNGPIKLTSDYPATELIEALRKG